MKNIEDNINDVNQRFSRSKEEAEALLKDSEKAKAKINEAAQKANEHKTALEKVWTQLQLFFSITKDYFNGTYKEIPTGSIVSIVAGLIYFLTPIDLIFDAIPVVGFIDDVFILGLVYKQVSADLERYENWKKEQG